MRFIYSLLFFIIFNVQAADIQLPALTSPVMDLAGMMSESQAQDLSKFAYEIYTNKGPQITVLTVPDLQGLEIEDYSIKVAEKWQLGSKEQDNGLLVIIAKAERRVRIEVGNGIEGEITDYDTAQYTRNIFPEYFKRGDFHGAVRLFMEDVATKFNIKDSAGNSYVRRAPKRTTVPFGQYFFMIIIGILIFGAAIFKGRPMARGLFTGAGFAGASLFMGLGGMILIIIFLVGLAIGAMGIGNFLYALASSGRGGRGGFGGGGFGGGGGWSGGGGGFSGGGSSGSW